MTSDFPDTITLFSGGDAPGMNPMLRALVRLGNNRYAKPLIGVRDGYLGLVRTAQRLKSGECSIEDLKNQILTQRGIYGLLDSKQDFILMENSTVTGLVVQGGIQLRTARCKDFEIAAVRQEVRSLLQALGIKRVIVCGGNGSLAGASLLAKESSGSLQVIGVPTTIDNDYTPTDLALGFQSAVATIVWAIDHFKDTAKSHRRVMVLETMGRKSGELTLMAAIAAGAEYAIVPEDGPLTRARIETIANDIKAAMAKGRTHTIVLIAEGVELQFDPDNKNSRANILCDEFRPFFSNPDKNEVEVEVRPSVLGHLQRGGRPDPADALLAARFAEGVWENLRKTGQPSGVIVLQQNEVVLVPFQAADTPRGNDTRRKFAELQHYLSGWSH